MHNKLTTQNKGSRSHISKNSGAVALNCLQIDTQKKNQRQLQSGPGLVVLAAILSIDTKQQDDDRGRQDAAEGAQTEGGKLQRKEHRAKARCGLAPRG